MIEVKKHFIVQVVAEAMGEDAALQAIEKVREILLNVKLTDPTTDLQVVAQVTEARRTAG